jgi:hypothetical protein
MKITYTVSPGCTIEQEVKDVKQGFSFLAYITEVFGQRKCGNCGSTNLKLRHRTPQGYDYYDVQCQDCRHEQKFGQAKETGRLFPKGWSAPEYDENKKAPARKSQDSPPPPQEDEREYQPAYDEIAF